MAFDCKFLGAAEDIGRLGFVLGTGEQKFLFDYGIAPDKPPLYPIPAPAIDQVFLTHAHVDHSGNIPWLASRHDGTILTTSITAEVSHLMHKDSVKISHLEGYPEPYSYADVDAVRDLFEHIGFKERVPLGNASAEFHSAGHIPGAAQVELNSENGGFVFTGDLYTRAQRLVGPGKPVKCDLLAMETTYAGREHKPRDETEEDFIAYVEDIVDRGGTCIVAAFAVGRAQEVAMVLAGKGFNVWLDGMGRRVAELYGEHPQYLRDAKEYGRALGAVKHVYNHRGRKVALKEADVIITTSGMVEGGPILYYIDQLRNDTKSGIALTGYQVKGTNGRRLMDTNELDLDPREPGKKVKKINMPWKHFDFSAHAGHKDMVEFARETGADDIILFHGDNREALAEDLSDFATVHMPLRGESFQIK
ncbi:MAG: MBL fold metallo-hydrolase [Thermoplasmatota archaeon]